MRRAYRPSAMESRYAAFCDQGGPPLKKDSWNDRLETYSRQIGFKIRPYDLRHEFAVSFLRSGGNVFGLQRILGHVNMDTTRRYVALAQSDIKEQHDSASPLRALGLARERVSRGSR